MGCFSSLAKARNIKLQQTKKTRNSTMQESAQNLPNIQQTAQLVSYISTIILSPTIENSEKPALVATNLQPHTQAKCDQIAKYFKNLLGQKQPTSSKDQQIRGCIVVSSHVVSGTDYYKNFSIFDKDQINQLGTHMQKQINIEILDCYLKFIEVMFLEHGFTIYTHSQVLFQAILKKFGDFSNDQKRQIGSQVIIQMLLENKKLMKFAKDPYYFLQFWLYSINIQEQLDRQLYWIQCVKKLYASDITAQQNLFYENDFKVLIDMLIRVMGSCPDGKALRVPLQCYLVLSCTKMMQPEPIRLIDVKQFIAHLDGESLGLFDLFKQINSLG